MKLKLQPPSGTELAPFNPILPPASITQIMLLANPAKVDYIITLPAATTYKQYINYVDKSVGLRRFIFEFRCFKQFFLQVGYSKFQCGAVMGVTTATSQFLFQHDYAPVYKTKCIQDLFGDWPAENPAPWTPLGWTRAKIARQHHCLTSQILQNPVQSLPLRVEAVITANLCLWIWNGMP